MEVTYYCGRDSTETHEYPEESNWLNLPDFIQIVNSEGKELAVYARASVVCIQRISE